MPERWDRLEQPLLDALAARGEPMADYELAQAAGLDQDAVLRALPNLVDDGFVSAVLIQPDQADFPVRA